MYMLVQFDAANVMNESSIGILVDRFYARVRQDNILGPIFAEKIGDDWEPHLETMRAFWSSLMLASGRYKGNPMLTHLLRAPHRLAAFRALAGHLEADHWPNCFRRRPPRSS